jgi:hypothetical protein
LDRQFRELCSIAALLVCVSAATLSAQAQSPTTEDHRFRVGPNQDGISLEIFELAPLSNVLSVTCNQAKVACTGLDLVARDNLPPMVVEGKFPTVVRQILEGSKVNFEYAHGNGQTRPKLTILRRSTSGPMPVPVASTPTSDNSTEKAAGVTKAESPSLETPTPPAVSAANMQETVQHSPPTAGQTDWRTAAEMMYGGGYAPVATPSEFLPFPGADGKPIPAGAEMNEFLPFPDQFGRPIPVTAAKPGSPFPVPTDQQPTK